MGVVQWLPSAALIASGLLGAVGLALVVRGRYGRRTGETPYCRKCGYNLTGVFAATSVEGGRASPVDENAVMRSRCPECGADVDRAGAVVRGERPRRAISLALGLIALLVAGGLGGVVAIVSAQKVDWYAKLPSELIAMDLGSANAEVAERAFDLLRTRMATTGVSAAVRDELINDATKQVRALRDRSAWRPDRLQALRWASGVAPSPGERALAFLHSEEKLQRLTEAQLRHVVEAVALPQLVCRRFYGNLEPIELTFWRAWFGDFGWIAELRVLAARASPGPDWGAALVGEDAEPPPAGCLAQVVFDANGDWMCGRGQVIQPTTTPGTYAVTLLYEIRVYRPSAPTSRATINSRVRTASRVPADAKLLHTFCVTQSVQIEILAGRAEDRIALVDPPGLGQAVRQYVLGARIYAGRSQYSHPSIFIGVADAPCYYAFDAVLEHDGQEVCKLKCVGGPRDSLVVVPRNYPDRELLPGVSSYTVRFRPNASLALEVFRGPDFPGEIFGSELVLNDVPVIRQYTTP